MGHLILKKIGVSSNYLIGKDGKIKRNKIIKALKNNQLQVLCLCGCFNEGISINNLKTVVFGDLRFSDINRIQIALRANRIHLDKAFFHIVLPIIEDDFSDDKIENMMKTFFKIDPKIKDSLKNGTKTRIRFKKDGIEFGEEATLKREEIFNSLCQMIKGLTQEEKVDELLEIMKERDSVPPQNKTLLFSDWACMGSFWQTCKSKGKLDKEPYDKLLENDILKEDYDKYLKMKDESKDKTNITQEEKVDEFLKWVEENNKIPPQNKTILFSNGACMGSFWMTCKLCKKLETEPYDKLLKNDILKEDYKKYLKKK